MSKRPTLWIHHTRRFWFGLALLLLMTGFVTAMGYYACLTSYRTKRPPITPHGNADTIDYVAGFTHGGFMYHRTDPSTHLYHLHSAYMHHSIGKWSVVFGERIGFKPLPEITFVDWQGMEQSDEPYLFLPLWPLVVIAAILWPIWMHRADKKEAETFANPEIPDSDA